MRKTRDYICHALDHYSSFGGVIERIENLTPYVGCFKVGLEAHTQFGNKLVEEILKRNRKVFLDLKFHDIPITVKKAVQSASSMGIHYLNVHTLGGHRMLEAAREGLLKTDYKERPKLIGVTMLTSHSEDELAHDLKMDGSMINIIRHLSKMSENAGLDGIVCSANDLPSLTQIHRDDFFYITPGIRHFEAKGDQCRTATPEQAIKNGSSMIVVGRELSNCSPDEQVKRANDILLEVSKYV